MKKIKVLLIVLLGISALCCTMPLPGKTTIYIVRHAEKEVSDPNNQDPELSPAGRERAVALALKLKNEKLDAVFSTKFKRTNHTATLVAQNNGIEVQIYEANDAKSFVELISNQYKYRRVLIVGHSNTILGLVEAFGAKRPLAALTEDDYDLFFEVNIDNSGIVTLRTQRYGKEHHSSDLK